MKGIYVVLAVGVLALASQAKGRGTPIQQPDGSQETNESGGSSALNGGENEDGDGNDQNDASNTVAGGPNPGMGFGENRGSGGQKSAKKKGRKAKQEPDSQPMMCFQICGVATPVMHQMGTPTSFTWGTPGDWGVNDGDNCAPNRAQGGGSEEDGAEELSPEATVSSGKSESSQNSENRMSDQSTQGGDEEHQQTGTRGRGRVDKK